MNKCPGLWSLSCSEILRGCPIPTDLLESPQPHTQVRSSDDPNLPVQARPLFLYATPLSLMVSWTTRGMVLGFMEGVFYGLEELVCLGNARFTFRRISG